MCRQPKRKYLKAVTAGALALLLTASAAAVFHKKPAVQNENCIIDRYKNLEIPITNQESPSLEQADAFAEVLMEEWGNPRTKEQFLQRTGGMCENREELTRSILSSLSEEAKYAAETQKRAGVLRAILKNSRFLESTEDEEETVLLAIYEAEGLELTEEEKTRGILALQNVFGVRSAEELSVFLSAEEQSRIIRKEKTYEYLLENNHFVVDSAASGAERRSGGGT